MFATLAVGAAGVAFYLAMSSRRTWAPGRPAGILFGITAATIVAIQALYPFRRSLAPFILGSAQNWLQFHIYGGVLGLLFVLIHSGFRSPAGPLGWMLLLVFSWATLSGLIGVWLQKWIPAKMASGLDVVAVFDRIPELVGNLAGEAAKLIEGSSEMLERFYREDLAPSLAGVTASWEYLLDVRGGRERRLAPFSRMSPFLAEDERPRLEELKIIYIQKLELDAQYSLYRLLRIWRGFHVPISVLLVGLIGFHVAMNLYYWWKA